MESKFIRLVPFSHHGLRDKLKKFDGFYFFFNVKKANKITNLINEATIPGSKCNSGLFVTRPVSKSLKTHV